MCILYKRGLGLARAWCDLLLSFAGRVACKAEANLVKKVAAASVAIPAFVASHPAFALVRDSQPDSLARTRFQFLSGDDIE